LDSLTDVVITAVADNEVLAYDSGGNWINQTAAEAGLIASPGSEAQGDVLYYNGTTWARLAAGTSGYFLKTQGAAANPVWAGEGWRLIASSVLSSGDGTFSFTSIPATYSAIALMLNVRSDRAAVADGIALRFNNDTGSNYNTVTFSFFLSGTTSIGGSVAQGYIACGVCDGNSATASAWTTAVLFVPQYANTNTYKAISPIPTLSSADFTAANTQGSLRAGSWKSTSAINRVDVVPVVGTNFKQYSAAYLYGIF
jgi:hypothetical protein